MNRLQHFVAICFLFSFSTIVFAGKVRNGRSKTELKSCQILSHKRQHTAHLCDVKETKKFDQSEDIGLGIGVDVFSINMFKGRHLLTLHAGNSDILGQNKVYCRRVHGKTEERRYIPNTVEFLVGKGCGDSEARFDVISTTNSDMNLVANRHGVSAGVTADNIPVEEGITVGFGFGGTSGESDFLKSEKASTHDKITTRHYYRKFCLRLNIDSNCYKKEDLEDGFMAMIDDIQAYVDKYGDGHQEDLTQKIEDLFSTYGNHYIHKVPYGGYMKKDDIVSKDTTNEVSLSKSQSIAKSGFDISLFGEKIIDTKAETDNSRTSQSQSAYSNYEFSSSARGLPAQRFGEPIGKWEDRVTRAPVAIQSEIVLKEIWKLPHVPKLAGQAIATYYTKKLKTHQDYWKKRHTFEEDCECKWTESQSPYFTWTGGSQQIICPRGHYQRGTYLFPSWSGRDFDFLGSNDDYVDRQEFKGVARKVLEKEYIDFKLYCCPLNCEL